MLMTGPDADASRLFDHEKDELGDDIMRLYIFPHRTPTTACPLAAYSTTRGAISPTSRILDNTGYEYRGDVYPQGWQSLEAGSVQLGPT